jgi:rod shape-determining protein MreD
MENIRKFNILALIILGVLFETTIAANFRIFSVSPTLGLLAVGLVAYHFPLEYSLVFSFISGIFLDVFLRTPFGISAAVFLVTGISIHFLKQKLLHNSNHVNILIASFSGLLGGAYYMLALKIFSDASVGIKFLIVSTSLDILFVPVIAPLIMFVFGRENVEN